MHMQVLGVSNSKYTFTGLSSAILRTFVVEVEL